jgi:hypothetical protein
LPFSPASSMAVGGMLRSAPIPPVPQPSAFQQMTHTAGSHASLVDSVVKLQRSQDDRLVAEKRLRQEERARRFGGCAPSSTQPYFSTMSMLESAYDFASPLLPLSMLPASSSSSSATSASGNRNRKLHQQAGAGGRGTTASNAARVFGSIPAVAAGVGRSSSSSSPHGERGGYHQSGGIGGEPPRVLHGMVLPSAGADVPLVEDDDGVYGLSLRTAVSPWTELMDLDEEQASTGGSPRLRLHRGSGGGSSPPQPPHALQQQQRQRSEALQLDMDERAPQAAVVFAPSASKRLSPMPSLFAPAPSASAASAVTRDGGPGAGLYNPLLPGPFQPTPSRRLPM